MDPNKLAFLAQMTGDMKNQSKDSMFSFLMSAMTQAENQGIEFTDDETDLFLSEFTKNMSPQEKQRISTMRRMAAMFAQKKR